MKSGRIPLGILSVAIILLLNLLAASPVLHERLHPDAGKAGHQCAATHFSHGHLNTTVVEVSAAIPVVPFAFHPPASISLFSASADLLPPGRAPPVSLLPS